MDLSAGTELRLTNNGWQAAGGFRAGETTSVYTVPTGGVRKGDVISYSAFQSDFSQPIPLAAAGDQLLLYQGSDAAPTFVAALTYGPTGFSEATSDATTALPPGLNVGTNAVALPDGPDAICATAIRAGLPAELRAAFNTTSSWTTSATPSAWSNAALSVSEGLVPDAQELAALQDFYNGTGGATTWTNRTGWLQGTNNAEHWATWFGLSTRGGDVTNLNLSPNNLQGTLPASLGDLTQLTQLWLRGNVGLTGAVPSELGQLAKLTSLRLSFCSVTGALPSSLGQLTQLEQLWLARTQLSGPIPAFLGQLTSLRLLNLSGSRFSGTLPPELGQLLNLEQLDIANGAASDTLTRLNLRGGLPATFQNLTKLQRLNISDQPNLKGTIPAWIGQLKQLTYICLDGNGFTGGVPTEITALPQLQTLLVYRNKLTSLPSRAAFTNPASLVLGVQDNALEFGALEPLFTGPGQFGFLGPFGDPENSGYLPQTLPTDTVRVSVTAGQDTALASGIGGTYTRYQWQRLAAGTWQSLAATDTTATYLLSNVSATSAGYYRCAATNTVATGVTLYSRPLAVRVSDAIATVTDPLRQKLNLIFANIDKSQVPTGRLADFAVPLAYLHNFDGKQLSDSSRTDMDGFRYLYVTAQSGRIAGTDTLPSIQSFNRRVLAAAPTAPDDAIPVAVQHIAYSRLRPDALSANLLRVNNEQLFDVAGRSESPYQAAVLFAAAPARTYSTINTVKLVLRRNLYLTDGIASINPALFMDLDDGQGYRPATWDQPLSATYASSGPKRVRVKLEYAAPDDTRESWFDLTVLSAPASADLTSRKNANAPTGATTSRYVPTVPAGGSIDGIDWIIARTVKRRLTLFGVTNVFNPNYTDHLGGKISVRYAPGHTSLVKPFIVAEGYDTSEIAPNLVGQNNRNNDIASFLTNAFITFQTTNTTFTDALQQAGYDLVYIDNNDGADDLRRNAALFEEVVRRVNEEKRQAGSTEPNVVMGMSMGGLVARYGLARMVRSGYNPQTRLLVLHDSPQRGANNPMGLQALTRQANFVVTSGILGQIRTTDLSDQIKDALAILAAPATSQLSLKNVTGVSGEYTDNTFIDGPYKTMVDFTPTGGTPATFPTIVATSDGSQCGRPQSTPPYQELTRNNIDFLFPQSLFFTSGLQSEAIANALPAYGTQNTIASLRIKAVVRVFLIPIRLTLLERTYLSPANTLPYETLPGGTTNLSDQRDLAGNSDSGFDNLWRLRKNTTLYNGQICFVPSYSAFDVPSVTSATAYAKYINNLTDNPAPPRVAQYIAQEALNGGQFNNAHIRFTARNSEWIFNEMQRAFNNGQNPLVCQAQPECLSPADVRISGPSTLCGPASFTTPLRGVANSYTWTATPASSFTTPTGTGPVFTTANSGDGYGTITLQIGGDCPLTLTKLVKLGAPDLPGIQTLEPFDNCTTFAGQFKVWNFDPTLSYSATTTGSLRILGNGISIDGTFGLKGGRSGDVVRVVATNSCGTATGQLGFTFDGCPGIVQSSLYPNPADSFVEVALDEPADPTAISQSALTASVAPSPMTVTVYNGQGRVVFESGEVVTPSLRLDTHAWPEGLYQVVMRHDGQTRRRQLSVQH